MFLLRRLSATLTKYLWIALVATTVSSITFAYLYKEALQDVARVKAEAQRDAAVAANARSMETAARLSAAIEERERVLLGRITELNRAARDAQQRADAADQVLRDYDTARLSDQDTEYRSWADTQLPSGVVTKLQELAGGKETQYP